jgi:hypothetical protein
VIGVALLLWPIPAAWTLVACLAGREARTHRRGWLSHGLMAMLGVVALVGLLGGIGFDADPVSSAALFAGILAAAGLPTLLFYALGYAVRGSRMAGALWFAGTLPLTAYAAVVLYLLTASMFCAGWGCPGGPVD